MLRTPRLTIALLTLTFGTLAACATNPATGAREFSLMSEEQEIQLGREADAQILQEMGVYQDQELQRYVSTIGLRLAKASERPHLPWKFTVVDEPAVNAFALPGGFIYVTRGILAHMSSEAELTSVLGHEIGHVTAQHSVNQMSKQQLAMGGLLVGAVLVPEVAQGAQLAQAGLSLLFLKYGRDDERQADDLGLRYMTRGGWDAREMPKMFSVLEGSSALAGAGRLPNWLSTHPDPAARRERSEQLIAERRYPAGETGVDRLLDRLDGLTFGHDPREGYFVGSTFYHPGLAFQLEIPPGWQAANEKQRLLALHPDGVAQLELRLAPGASADQAAQAFLNQQGVTPISSRRTRVNGLTAVRADFSVQTQRAISGRATFVQLGSQVFQVIGLVYSDRAVAASQAFELTLGSFKSLKDPKRLDVEPQRVVVTRLPRAMSWNEFAASRSADVDPRQLLLMNGISDPNAVLPAGTRVKWVEGRKAGEQTANAGR